MLERIAGEYGREIVAKEVMPDYVHLLVLRNSSANTAVIPHRPTNMPHATSCGLDWPFTPKTA